MKKNLLRFFTMALFATMLTVNFTSCTEDACENAICNNGTCVDGDCLCDPGFVSDPLTGDCVDVCANVECNNGTCFDGECICDVGFELDPLTGDCVPIEAPSDKFLGSYQATEPDCGVNTPYEVLVEQDIDGQNSISLRNLGNYGCNDVNGEPINYHVIAFVDADNPTIVTIDNYETCSTVFSGQGTLDGNTFTITYSATYDDGTGNAVTDNCTAILER